VENTFTVIVPLFVIVMSVLGGRNHWLGPVIGATVIVLLQDRLAGSDFEHLRYIAFGGLLAVMVIFAPTGLYARLRARPLACLVVAAGMFGALTVAATGQLLDRVAVAMLATVLVAFWPARWWPVDLLPARWRHWSPPGTTPAPRPPAEGGPVPDPDSSVSHTPSPPTAGPGVAPPPGPPSRPGRGPGTGTPAAAGSTAGTVIECRDVARHFGGVRALDGVDLRVDAGELVGLVGPNGSGKTTLVNLLSGGLRPTRGTIRVAGRDTARLAPHTFTHVGMARTYQIPRPFESMTVRDNVAMALMFGRRPRRLAEARAQARAQLEFVGLAPLADALPADINLHQRQLLEMARALATSPRVLLLDEALAGLNPAEIDDAVQVVRRIHGSGVTIVIVEHLLRVVNQLATRVVVLDRGKVLADGDPSTVMSDPAVVGAYLGRSGRQRRPVDAGGTGTAGERGDA
jgi:branched-chain amino acid transport system permease protein